MLGDSDDQRAVTAQAGEVGVWFSSATISVANKVLNIMERAHRLEGTNTVIVIDSVPGLIALFLSALASRPTLVRSGFVLPPADIFVAAPGRGAWEISAKNVSMARYQE